MESPPIFVVRLAEPGQASATFQAINAALAPCQLYEPPADLDVEALGDTSLYGARALARAAAHVALWKQCAQSEAPLTVCDDDAVLRADFQAAAGRLLHATPGYDYVLWGWRTPALLDVRPAARPEALVTADADAAAGSVESFQAGETAPALLLLATAVGACCYTLSPQGARRLLSRVLPLAAFSLQSPFTAQPRANSDLDVAVSRCLKDLSAFASLPPLAADVSRFAPAQASRAPPITSRAAALQAADTLQRHGRAGEALAILQVAAETSPDNPVVLGRLGAALAAEGRFAAASATLERALDLDERDQAAAYNLAALRLRQQRHAEALVLLGRVLERDPSFGLAHANAGVALLGLGRHAEAEAAFRRALQLEAGSEEARQGLAAALVIRSGLHEQKGEFEQAHAAALEATRLQPDLPGAFNNLGVALLRLGRPAEAAEAYRSALALSPGYADAHYGVAFALLNQGRFREAWLEYDWRLKTSEFLRWTPGFAKPRWDGAACRGAALLLVAEQGLGDAIMTARLAVLARERVGRIILRVPRTLVRFLARLPGVEEVVAEEAPAPEHDLWCPLMSLPGLLDMDSAFSPESLPKLGADADSIRSWGRRLPQDGLRVGIAWQGNPAARVEHGRSIPLSAFRALTASPGVRLVSLQKGKGSEQLAEWTGQDRPLDLGEAYRLGDFADTAAVVSNLDLVITCDTSVGHLSGALGRPTWIAIGANPDWRWLKDRQDTIWYESARLFRLRPGETWDALFRRMRSQLPRR